jgi:hypothetical protein
MTKKLRNRREGEDDAGIISFLTLVPFLSRVKHSNPFTHTFVAKFPPSLKEIGVRPLATFGFWLYILDPTMRSAGTSIFTSSNEETARISSITA